MQKHKQSNQISLRRLIKRDFNCNSHVWIIVESKKLTLKNDSLSKYSKLLI